MSNYGSDYGGGNKKILSYIAKTQLQSNKTIKRIDNFYKVKNKILDFESTVRTDSISKVRSTGLNDSKNCSVKNIKSFLSKDSNLKNSTIYTKRKIDFINNFTNVSNIKQIKTHSKKTFFLPKLSSKISNLWTKDVYLKEKVINTINDEKIQRQQNPDDDSDYYERDSEIKDSFRSHVPRLQSIVNRIKQFKVKSDLDKIDPGEYANKSDYLSSVVRNMKSHYYKRFPKYRDLKGINSQNKMNSVVDTPDHSIGSRLILINKTPLSEMTRNPIIHNIVENSEILAEVYITNNKELERKDLKNYSKSRLKHF